MARPTSSPTNGLVMENRRNRSSVRTARPPVVPNAPRSTVPREVAIPTTAVGNMPAAVLRCTQSSTGPKSAPIAPPASK